jgi:hypothetical protein
MKDINGTTLREGHTVAIATMKTGKPIIMVGKVNDSSEHGAHITFNGKKRLYRPYQSNQILIL